MTQIENNNCWDAEAHLPASLKPEFVAAALLHLAENKVEFGVRYEENRIVIGYDPADDHYLPSKWSDGRWHIGREETDDPGDD